MKRVLIKGGIGVLILILGFAIGAFYLSAKSGYHYKLLKEKDYESALGPVKWSCFMESVGFPFLDTDRTMITIGNRTIYKAQRGFQEGKPIARNIEISGQSITWEDGDYRYHLTMEAMTEDETERPNP
ncbi:MAG: hypothetical protein KDK99_16665 [Verrucomicrobiales bacterium]|nr:hypothetical protein [Verrucomicrobiales bacterium]